MVTRDLVTISEVTRDGVSLWPDVVVRSVAYTGDQINGETQWDYTSNV
jgi:hypothetical protein